MKFINMSRVGKQQLIIPAGVTMEVADSIVRVKGPKGTLEERLPNAVHVEIADSIATVRVDNPEEKKERSLWGTFGSLIANMLEGVTRGFERKLEVQGVGYRVALQGKDLRLDVGFSHPVDFPLSTGITAKVEKNVITISGIDKQLVGETAATIRRLRPPEPYKGKGIKYADEIIRRKAGKVVKAAGSG